MAKQSMKSRQKNKPSGPSRIPCSVGDVAPGRGRHKAAQVVIKRNPCRLRVGCVNVGTLRGRSGGCGGDGRQKAFGLLLLSRKRDGKEMVLLTV